MHHQRLGETKCQRSDRVAQHAHLNPRAAVDPLALRRDRDLDVVVEHVEGGLIVFVVRAAASGKLFVRRVDADVLAPFSVEKRHVLRFGARSGVGQRGIAGRANLRDHVAARGQERPQVPAEVAQVHGVRFGNLLAKHFPSPTEVALVDGARRQSIRREERRDILRVDPHEDRLETSLKHLGPAEDLQLSFFHLRRGMESDLAAAEDDHTGCALIDLRHERRALGEDEVEILDRNREIPRVELLGWIERQPIQILDDREPMLAGDSPSNIGPVPNALDVERPGRAAGPGAKLGKDVDREAIPVAWQRAA